ncbi:Ig-like domain-containing protein [Staphylococcus delphini]|uniref:Ig-like domain-containing protein n=1 Tax=Staphylococcus delphini TaxID=53344 RepID=UPI000BBB916C|nr:Ig-like domain-containing protein [Staphylococcus delphini]EMC0274948.1 Ig domain-containing protein [Staphylococcus pseudintermedius]PCF83011.1 phage tail protein [Staphylococcus delphini]
MTRILKLYTNGELKDTAEGKGRLTVGISGLSPATSYPAGIYQISFEENGRESELVQSPAFTTKPILVTSITFPQNTLSLHVGEQRVLTPTVSPNTATKKAVIYTSSYPDYVTVDRNTGTIHAVSVGTSVITALATDGTGKLGRVTVTVTAA